MPKLNRIRSTQRNRHLNYSNLEPRVMLSADLDAARNLVIGGDFETDGASAFIAFADGDDTNLQTIDIISIATDRSNIVELDSIAGQLDSIAQDIITETDNQYIVSFDLRGRPFEPGDAQDTNSVEVLFGGQSAGVFASIDKWQTINVAVSTSSDLTRLEFREAAGVSDGKGILLDHISVAGVREVDVVNSSIENVEGEIVSGVVESDNLPGFFAVDESGTPEIGVWAVDDATDGFNVLNLNTSDSHLDRVFQNIQTENGSNYFVTFDLRNGDTTDSNPANVRLRWNGQFAGSFFGTSEWQRFGMVLESTSDFSTFMFRESGASIDSNAQVDNIKVFRINSLQSDFVVDLNGDNPGVNYEANYIENSELNVSGGDLALRFANGDILSSATARILDYDGSELLSANTSGTNIEVSFDESTGIFRLVGRDSVDHYQQVLRTIAYLDSSDQPSTDLRRIVVSVTDGTATSDRVETELTIFEVNDAPVISALPDIPISQGNTTTVNVAAFDPDDSELSYELAFAGDTFIFGDGLPTISDSGQIQITPTTFGSADVTVVVTDPAGLTTEFTFTVDVPFELPSANIPPDFSQYSGERQLSNTTPSLRNGIYDAAPPMTIDTSLNYQAVIDTTDGEIRFELFASESPLTVNNFVNLAEDGFFDGLTFHRVISNFVAQGGDPAGTGGGGPGYQFADELDNGLSFDGFGQLAMANSGANTNGSQFFFTLNDAPAFAGQHTIFGQVISGEQVLRDVNLTSGSNSAEIIRRVRIEIV